MEQHTPLLPFSTKRFDAQAALRRLALLFGAIFLFGLALALLVDRDMALFMFHV